MNSKAPDGHYGGQKPTRCEAPPGPYSSHSPVVPALACTTSDRTIAVRVYRVTISVPGDVSPALIKHVLKTYDSNNKFVVVEKGVTGKKHLHMLLQFAAPKQKKDLRDVLLRFIKKHHPDAKGCALVCNAAYNMDWYTEYLRKEEDVENVDTDNFDAELFESALPDKSTQDALQVAQRRRPIGAYWIDHEKQWMEYSPDNPTYESAICYFKHRMYLKRDMEPISNLRKLREIAYTLWSYRNKAVSMDFGDRAFMEKEFSGENIFKATPFEQ